MDEEKKEKNYFYGITPETRKKQQAKSAATQRARDLERKAGLRAPRGVDPITCDVSYTDDEVEFLKAVEQYKSRMKRPFPTLRELLNVLKSLGYTKPSPPGI